MTINNYKIKEIVKSDEWDDFFNRNGSPSFLHSWQWGEFQKKQGQEIIRIAIFNKKELTLIALIIKVRSKRGNFLFIPHGPIFIKQPTLNVKRDLQELKNYLINLAKKEKFSFIRIAPILENTHENIKLFKELNFKTAPIYMHAETVWTLPLYDVSMHRNLTDEELLSRMRKTTRYSIRKAVRDGVVIEKRTDDKAVDDFHKIYLETVKREKFIPFSKQFIKDEFESFYKSGNISFLFACLRTPEVKVRTSGVLLASALIIFTKSTAFYHQGASVHAKYPAPYLLQWEAIKEAKKLGCQFYNFWVIYKPALTQKSWSGLTFFKQGFGGYQVDYVPTQDLIISPKYYLTYLYERYLNLKRGIPILLQFEARHS